jgi:outer membrane protein OmpA-like peptidoglycan-associated protein
MINKKWFIVSLMLFYLAANGADSSYAFTWFWSKKEAPKKEPVPPALEIRAITNSDQYSRIVRNLPDKNSFIICSQCPVSTQLEREMQGMNVVIRMSSSHVPEPDPKSAAQSPLLETASIEADTVSPTQKETHQEPPVPAVLPEQLVEKTPKAASRSSCIDSHVYFDLNSAEINAVEKKKLLDSIRILKSGRDIEVTGYTCDLGTKDYNDELAIRRANSVGDLLLREMSIPVVTLKGTGKCCYVSDDKSKNRRVEITCIKTKQEGD